MRKTKLSDFTGKDAIRLAIALYSVKELYRSFDAVIVPRLRTWAQEMEEKRLARLEKVSHPVTINRPPNPSRRSS